ncbi:MAG TPA: cellulose synthase family protein [Myxococcales bacterium]|nr:cellulose synthase family protein [Myxococcales bacterium]
MSPSEIAFLCLYFAVMLVVSLYGGHRYVMAYLYFKHKYNTPEPLPFQGPLPRVTVQLPIYNEMYVCERLIESVCAIEYPRELLEVQVLDDSTDETREIAAAAVERCRASGIDIRYLHRDDRRGYKAGALEEGLKSARGELIAVFDADFVPAPDFLRRTVPHFSEPRVGMVQVRWGHLNRAFSVLTQAQSIMLDGHFVIEHTARNRSGRFFNFNGTAGIWRRSAIVDAGGWHHDTLTEDLDLSYRAQLRGWQFVFLPEVVSPAEVPVEMNAFKSQQHRWAKGSIQTAKKLLPEIFRSDLPRAVKVEAFFHLTNNLAYLLMVLISVLMPISVVVRYSHGWYGVLLLDFPFFVAATLSVCGFYVASQREVGRSWWQRLKYLPFLMSLGIGLSINNARAVIEALFNHQSAFTRTPKHGVGETGNGRWAQLRYRGSWVGFQPFLEVALGCYLSCAVWFVIDRGLWASLPFLVLSQIGFLYVGLMSLLQGRFSRQPLAAEAT